MDPNQTKRFRNLASTIGILILLAGVFGFYYLKYVPERQAEFNRNAFLELGQIQTALQSKGQAYWDAFRNIIPEGKIDPEMLAQFNYKHVEGDSIDKDDEIQPSNFEQDYTTRRWNMVYNVTDTSHAKNKSRNKSNLVCTLSKDVDTLVSGLVSTYRDIFDGYLLICKTRRSYASDQSDKKNAVDTEKLKARIIYHSDGLSMDFLVNPDSLLQRNEGVSTMNILDVMIAGNPYKLFLYPFEMGKQKLILTGLISDSNYRAANQKIPFTFFTIFLVLILLLVIHLPILRIYVLGPNERIRATDIRLIIGSYFIAAFFGFFLFTKLFLDEEQSIQNRKHLDTMAQKITNNFYDELHSISRQLRFYDEKLDSLSKKDSRYLRSMSNPPLKKDTALLNKLFKPGIYPYSTGVFWISDSGQWVARWSNRRSQTNTKMIGVKDRSYFTDFKTGRIFSIPGKIDTFTIQPTLSKLEGEYIITVAKKSYADPVPDSNGKKDKKIRPFYIGLSARMHSVSNVVMPPGYGFSMIDPSGNILFDSKEGRPLLSNIFKEVEDPDGIRQTAIYRNRRYFKHLLLRSKNSAFLSTPVNGTPYQLLVYYNRVRSDAFEEHLVALSAGLIGTVICMVLFSALINQWAKTKNRMLESRAQHFEWLHPSGDLLKQKYYRHLITWMLLLLGIYLLAWWIMDGLSPGSEFSMLFISLLLPFYTALHYYELRERYYDVHEHRTGINWYFSRPSLALRCHILFIVVIINSFVPFYKLSKNTALPVLITQLAWAIVIVISTFWFRKYMQGKKIAGIPACLEMSAKNPAQQIKYKIPVNYIWAILIGVSLISVIPASGIFWLFFREETGLYQNADQLMIASHMDQRRLEINQYLKDYKFSDADAKDRSDISDLKFSHGIYTISGWTQADDTGIIYSPVHYPSKDYIHLHELIIPNDSIAWTEPTDTAADGSWYFGKEVNKKNAGPALVFLDRRDIVNPTPFHLTADSTAFWNTAGLLGHSFSADDPTFPIFFIVGLGLSLTVAYFLTLSLSKRIFLMELQIVTNQVYTKTNLARKTFEASKVRRPVKLIMLQTCRQLREGSSQNENNRPIYFPGLPGLENIYRFEKKLPMSMLEAKMPSLINTLEPVYQEIWNSLSPRQKFILFDFAQDGFANYKAGNDLQVLIEKGILFFDDLRLSMVTLSFQEYVLQRKEDKELSSFFAKAKSDDTWKKFKTPLLILLTAAGIFMFATQEEVYKKITGLLTTLTSLLPLLGNMFSKQAPTDKGDTE